MSAARVRWAAKKAGRAVIAHGTHALSACGRVAGIIQPGLRVLTYHAFGDRDRDAFCVSAGAFAAQMRHLAQHCMAIDLKEFERRIDSADKGGGDRVLVTIDDGLRSVREIALPILREYRIPAVVFASAGFVGVDGGKSGMGPCEGYMDWNDLEHLVKHGIEVQSHGWAHHAVTRLSATGLNEALSGSKSLLEERLGSPVFAFAYPYGTRADFDLDTARAVERAGYRLAFTSQHGQVKIGTNRHLLPRVKVEGGEGISTFAALVKGGLDPWRWVDKSLWRLQANH